MAEWERDQCVKRKAKEEAAQIDAVKGNDGGRGERDSKYLNYLFVLKLFIFLLTSLASIFTLSLCEKVRVSVCIGGTGTEATGFDGDLDRARSAETHVLHTHTLTLC